MKCRVAWLLGWVVLAVSVCGVAAADTLRVSAIPDEDPQELLRKYKPFADYIAREVGMKVKFIPVVDYAATVEGLAAGRLDIVWYGGFTSVQATQRAKGATRLAMREEDASFKSVFVTRTDSGIKTLGGPQGQDLRIRQRELYIGTPDAASFFEGGGGGAGAGLQEIRLQRRS